VLRRGPDTLITRRAARRDNYNGGLEEHASLAHTHIHTHTLSHTHTYTHTHTHTHTLMHTNMYAQTHAHAHTYKQDVVKLPIQINGKVRATLEVQRDIVQEDAVQASSVLQHLQGS